MGELSALAEALHRFEPPWIEVGRVYRRICFLRFEGRANEAQVVEATEFAEAAAKAREASTDGVEAESIMKGILAEEKERGHRLRGGACADAGQARAGPRAGARRAPAQEGADALCGRIPRHSGLHRRHAGAGTRRPALTPSAIQET
jgi:hypothetical protein